MSKVQLQGNVSGTGVFTIASPNSNTDRTLTLPDNTGTLLTNASVLTRANMPVGSIIQVVQTVKSDTSSTTSTSFGDLPGMSVSITPTTSTNRILIQLSFCGIVNTTNNVSFNLLRNGVNIGQPDGSGVYKATLNHFASGGGSFGDSLMFLDSPATTSAITYKIQWRVDAGTALLNRHASGVDYNSISTITAMEVVA